MKYLLYMLPVCLLLCTTACNNEEIAPRIENVPSQICNDALGLEGLYWDISNGRARGDIPGGLPTIANIGGHFIHSGYPFLGFMYPAGFRPFELRQEFPQLIGVNVLRDDNRALWRYMTNTFLGRTDANQVVQFEINEFIRFFNGNPQQVQVVCNHSGATQPIPTILTTNASVLLRMGDMTAVFVISVNYASDLNISFVATQVSFAPTAEFGNEVLRTFLPIHWQLLVNENGVQDSDGDGVPDHLDRFPFDPSRS